MNHYPHHIGDFDKSTRHLTRLERSVYRDMLDLYYDTEQQLPLDHDALCRRIVAAGEQESTAVEQVLNEFFTKTPQGWYHVRCEQEISKYHANNSQKALAGKASAAAKALKKQRALNGDSTSVEIPLNGASTNPEPRTQNPEPRTKVKNATAPHHPEITESLMADFLEVRRAKKAGKLTDTAIAGLRREADKAGLTLQEAVTVCCELGWQGFNANWYADRQKVAGMPAWRQEQKEQTRKAVPKIALGNPVDFFTEQGAKDANAIRMDRIDIFENDAGLRPSLPAPLAGS